MELLVSVFAFCLVRKRVEYLRNHIFYHRAKGEHPERKKSIKSSNKTTPEKTGCTKVPLCSVPSSGLNFENFYLHYFSSFFFAFVRFLKAKSFLFLSQKL